MTYRNIVYILQLLVAPWKPSPKNKSQLMTWRILQCLSKYCTFFVITGARCSFMVDHPLMVQWVVGSILYWAISCSSHCSTTLPLLLLIREQPMQWWRRVSSVSEWSITIGRRQISVNVSSALLNKTFPSIRPPSFTGFNVAQWYWQKLTGVYCRPLSHVECVSK